MTQAQLIAKAVASALAGMNVQQPKAAKKSKGELLSAKDKALIAGFKKKGITNVVLMDRTDPSKEFNVRPFGKVAKDDQPAKGWIAQGRIVKKGEHGVQGLFHVDQTEELTAKPE